MVPPGLLQADEEEVWSAEQQDFRQRRAALGQRGEILVDHRVEQRSDDLLHRHARLQQRIGIGLGEDAALAADLVQRATVVAHLRELLQGNLQLARGLLDEGTGSSRTRALHEHLLRARPAAVREEDRLHVLAADLADEVDGRVIDLDRRRDGDHLLHDAPADERGDVTASGTGEEDPVTTWLKAVAAFEIAQEVEDLLGGSSAMALIVLRLDRAGLARDDVLARRTADIDSTQLHACPSVAGTDAGNCGDGKPRDRAT